LITFDRLARVRRELENVLILIDELELKGIERKDIVKLITNESKGSNITNECTCKNKPNGKSGCGCNVTKD
jgi:hypothetical protein